MNVEEHFKKVLVVWLKKTNSLASSEVKILSYDQEIDVFGGCETCGPIYDTSVNIHYQVDGASRLHNYYGSFAELIKELGAVELDH